MTEITILYDIIRWEEKSIIQAAKKKGIGLKLQNARDIVFDINEDYKEEDSTVILQRCISYYRNYYTTALLELKGCKVVNTLRANNICGDKLLTSLHLVKNNIPTPKTSVSFSSDSSLKSLEKLKYPAILNPVIGSWGKLMAILNDSESAYSIFEDRENMYPIYQVHYIQEKVKRPPRDIRAIVIGDEVIAAIYRTSEGSWRTNMSRGGKAENCPITKELEDITLQSTKFLDKGIYGVDLMETDNGLVVHEINNTTEFKNTVPNTGVDIPGKIIDFLLQIGK